MCSSTGAMKTCVVALEEVLRKKKDRIKLSLPPKLMKKLVYIPPAVPNVHVL
jgi:hypothetical protein